MFHLFCVAAVDAKGVVLLKRCSEMRRALDTADPVGCQ